MNALYVQITASIIPLALKQGISRDVFCDKWKMTAANFCHQLSGDYFIECIEHHVSNKEVLSTLTEVKTKKMVGYRSH